jgi:hypothetical protein
VLHARARWIGVALFALALLALGAALVGLPIGWTSVGDVMIGMLAAGLSLGTFGSHCDTALALLRDRRWHEPAPACLADEIDAEVLFHRLELSELKGTPRTAWALTLLAPLALAWAVLRLVG